MNRWGWFAIGLAVSVGVTILLWGYAIYAFVLLVGIPLALWSRRPEP